MKFLPLGHQDLQGLQVHEGFQELRWQAFLQTWHLSAACHAGDQVDEANEFVVGPEMGVLGCKSSTKRGVSKDGLHK